MVEVRSGLVFAYSYLWAREYDRGEESGRKDRPVCVQLIVRRGDGDSLTMLFPITSQPPQTGRAILEILALEARRAGLRIPAWIVVDEWNEDDHATSAYLADTAPSGAFGKSFTAKIARAAANAIREQNYRRVKR